MHWLTSVKTYVVIICSCPKTQVVTIKGFAILKHFRTVCMSLCVLCNNKNKKTAPISEIFIQYSWSTTTNTQGFISHSLIANESHFGFV